MKQYLIEDLHQERKKMQQMRLRKKTQADDVAKGRDSTIEEAACQSKKLAEEAIVEEL